jgi:uncharacterized protein involved in exopolysaccharide biosynthesis
MHLSHQDRQTVTLHEYFHVVAKRSRLILFPTLTAAMLAVIASFFLTSIYSATAKILPPQQESGLLSSIMGQVGSLASVAGDVVGKGSKSDMYVELLKSETVMDPIIDRFQLMKLYKQDYRRFTRKMLEDRSAITAGKKSGIISVTVDDKDPKRAADIANAYVEELDKLLKSINTTGAGQNRQFLENRLAGARADLARAEEALKTFQAKNKTLNITEQAKASIEGIAKLKAELAIQEVRLAGLQRKFADTSQEVKNAKTATTSLRSQIDRLEESEGRGAIPSIGSFPEIGKEYVRLMREFKTQEALVELLTKQYEMARFSEASTVPAVQVVQVAKAPDFKSKPSKRKLIMLVTLCALFLSTAFAFVAESVGKMNAEERERWRSSLRLVPLLGRFV